MSDASTGTQESPATRTGPLRLMVLLATGVMALSALQFALAGFGAFGRNYTPHVVIGWVIAGLSVLVLIAAAVARPGMGTMIPALALAVFSAILSPLLVEMTGRGGDFIGSVGDGATPWIGGLHAFIGLVIFGCAGRLMGAGRGGPVRDGDGRATR